MNKVGNVLITIILIGVFILIAVGAYGIFIAPAIQEGKERADPELQKLCRDFHLDGLIDYCTEAVIKCYQDCEERGLMFSYLDKELIGKHCYCEDVATGELEEIW